VAKCGYVSFRSIEIRLPVGANQTGEDDRDLRETSTITNCNCGRGLHDSKIKKEPRVVILTVDHLRFSSLYFDNSCSSILSICINNVTIKHPSTDGSTQIVKFRTFEFPIDKLRGDFFTHYSRNFNITLCDIVIPSKNFQYKIERLNLCRRSSTGDNQQQCSLNIQFNNVIFSDLSIPEVQQFSEMPEEQTTQRIMFIEQLDLIYLLGPTRNIHLNLNGDSFLACNLEFYLNFEHVIQNIRQFVKSIKGSQTSSETYQRKPPKPNEGPPKQPLNLKLVLNGRLRLGAVVSKDQTVCLDTQTLDVTASFPGIKKIESELLCLNFDEQTILTCSMAKVTYHPSPGVASTLDRQQNSCGFKLSDMVNSLLNIEIELVTIFFPYGYDFASIYNEKLMGCIKWLKVYYKSFKKSASRRSDSGPVDFDISLRINKFLFEIEDDMFETKLRANYMLLEDEYREQLKRDQTLQEKINELKKTNLMLASSIVEELNRALAKKNSDIYIQRSKQLYSSEARMVPLFSVVIEEADLKILADSSYHKHHDIRSIIKSLNPESQLNVEFSTIFCRLVSSNFKSVECSLRDFNLPMLSMNDLTIKGMILGTEQVAHPRAKRSCEVYMGRNMGPSYVERSMTPLKMFHNLQVRCTTANYTHGPCWDPVLQQVSLAFDRIVSASSDPSPSLPWWDKMRYLYHGQAKLNCNQLSVFLHASNDPYNQTELIEMSLSRALVDCNTGIFKFKGDFDILLRTASKYDECRFMHIPNFDLTINLTWNCLGNSYDHSTIMPCAKDKVPDYSSYQSHDSYRSFRSQSLSMSMNLETQFTSPSSSMNPENMPSMLFFGSTIRWLENLKSILFGPSKLTRRGVLFDNAKPRKVSFSRIFKDIRLNVSLNRFQILYWSSVSKKHGIHVIGGQISHCSQHIVKIVNASDGLKRRPRADWQTAYMNSSLANVEVWLYNLASEDLDEFNEFNTFSNLKNRQYFISFNRVTYNKESTSKQLDDTDEFESSQTDPINCGPGGGCSASENVSSTNDMHSTKSSDEIIPNHRLIVHDLKAAWTKDNRDVVVGIFDAYVNSQQLKRNLSTEALKPVRIDQSSGSQAVTSQQSSMQQNTGLANSQSPPYRQHQRHPSTTSLILINGANASASSNSKSRAVSMLQKLIADSENNPNVYTEETHLGVASETHLYGVEACQMDDVVDINCLIELRNSQVMLCGTETPGYVIVSAAHTEIRQATHLPVWKNRALLSKTTWTGSLRCMQYYATVDGQGSSPRQADSEIHTPCGGTNRTAFFLNEDDIQWLEPDNIDSRRSDVFDYPDLVGSGHSVGGVVSPTVGKLYEVKQPSSSGCDSPSMGCQPVQLQRIISRCNCLFYYAGHTMGVPDEMQHLIPPLPEDDMFIEPWDKEVGVDSFTLTHQDLDISTNSQQYSMILDIINNLLLFVEPHKKTAFEKLERMRFKFQLSADEDQREPISQLQDQVRKYVSYLKRLEKERYLIYRASIDASIDAYIDEPRLQRERERDSLHDRDRANRRSLTSLSEEISNVKEQLNIASEELAMMISCFKELQLGAHKAQKQQAASQQTGGTGAIFANVLRRNEICFQSARWRVTDSDGQLGLADIVLNNFLYSKVVKSDDSVEHTIELGHLHVSNLIPNQAYKDVLHPTELQANIPLDRQRALRIYCRELAPVAGIPVKEHLEINVVPFTIEVTLQFFQKMVKFFFPERESSKEAKRAASSTSNSNGGNNSSFESSTEQQLTRFGSKMRSKDKDKDAKSKSRIQSQQLDVMSITSSDFISSASDTGNPCGKMSSVNHTFSLNNLRLMPDDTISTVSTATMNSQGTTVSSKTSSSQVQRRGEEIEKMRQRASKNHTFVYVKIPGIPIKVSYKGKKQKSVTDLKNISLTLPTYEYHNLTWTWLDLLMAVKNDSKHTVIKQALKQKMKIRPSSLWSKAKGNSGNNHLQLQLDCGAASKEASSATLGGHSKEKTSTTPVTDEDKARLLLGQYAKRRRMWEQQDPGDPK